MDIEDAGRLHRYRASARSEHWATALTRAGRKVCDKALPNDEARLRALYDKLAGHGSLLVVVDQPATIGALAVAVAQETGITVSYLPGLSMRRIADLTPGSAKTDAKDAAVIADAARSMPHTLRSVSTSDEDAAALSMLTGFDLDLARQVNQTANRIRGLHTQTPPSPRAGAGALAGRTTPPGRPVAAWPTPADLKRAGRTRIDAKLKAHGCRRHTTWAGQSSRPWSTRAWWSPAPTPPQWCCRTWRAGSSPHALSGLMSPPRTVALAGGPPSCARS